MDKILVVGGGSWGTAFANYLTLKNQTIKIWIREESVIQSIKLKRENSIFLPGISLSKYLIPVSDLESEVREAKIIIFAVPSKFIRQTFYRLKNILHKKILVNLSKGFESASLKTISELATDIIGPDTINQWVTLSGPSFAKELAQNFPTAVVAGSKNETILKQIQQRFSSNILRIYRSGDLTGIEVAGSLKNIMAIASGIANGCGYGYNTTTALITRANMEISRFGIHMGAKKETFWGLAGIGDLILTCFGSLSRNFQLGVRVAKGESLEEIEKTNVMIAEGVETTKAIKSLSDQLNMEMPISSEVYQILFNKKKPEKAIKELMKRSLKPEWNLS
ncbi:MAG: NAD(P)-dependent glycerol-3-phosphate dehydrogenase [Candidatus Aminicenantes bacterium]|nr:NAD(P)-dependent glycerol-3-phosphate dehydrogenase [Candidatus Aminicenantes bacterium]